MRLVLLCILLTGCTSYYEGTVTEIFIGQPRVEVRIDEDHYVWAVNYNRDTLTIGDKAKVDKETLWMIK